MKSIIFICPYFGKLPQHFQLWLKSCEKNPDIEWIVFTDDKTNFHYPFNVKVKYISFESFVKYIQSNFDFNIALSKPYKLCDYRPSYGHIFEEYIQGYDFWGYCDLSDCIFGNIRKFLTDKILSDYDKILFLGHMTLYKNTYEINGRYVKITKSGVKIQSILQDEDNMAFDELTPYSINTIYKENNYNQYRNDEAYADISPMRYAFQLSKYDEEYKQYYEKKISRYFKWEKGALFGYFEKDGIIEKQEYLYVHFQKRNMKLEIDPILQNEYLIVPNKFIIDDNKTSEQLLYLYGKNKLIYKVFWKQKFYALKWHIKHI